MILLDTHVWIWWVQNDRRLKPDVVAYLDELDSSQIGISAISCWEAATLHQLGRLTFSTSLESWMEMAIGNSGLVVHGLTPEVATECASLPGQFHRDPADRMIVATARILDCSLVTEDERILQYGYVRSVKPSDLARKNPG